MIFSLHHVIDSLAGMLTGAYPDYPVYDSPNQQGTSFPCFFLFFMPSTIEEHVGNHYFRDLGVDLVFVQQRNLVNGNRKIHEIAEFLDRNLDLLFVVCFHMEVAGAALATIMSQLLSAVLVMITLIRTKESYRFIPKELRVEPVLLKRIIKIGLPAGLQSMMYSISNILIQANINGYGTNTIASWAV